MIVRKYETFNDYVEFWVKDGVLYVMVTDSEGLSTSTQLNHLDAEDLRSWLYEAVKQIEPLKKEDNG